MVLAPPSLRWHVSPSPGPFLLYTFSIRQKGDRDEGLKGKLGSMRKGFTPLIQRSVLMRDLSRGRDGEKAGTWTPAGVGSMISMWVSMCERLRERGECKSESLQLGHLCMYSTSACMCMLGVRGVGTYMSNSLYKCVCLRESQWVQWVNMPAGVVSVSLVTSVS